MEENIPAAAHMRFLRPLGLYGQTLRDNTGSEDIHI
jgi:hypothetical protein